MNEKYSGLYQMMEQSREARKIFSSLPDYVQDSIVQRADNVCSVTELQNYADNLLQGDR